MPLPKDLTLTEGLREADVAFVMATWAESFRHSKAGKPIPTKAFHLWHRPRMERILARDPLVVMARGADPLFLYGYGIFERVDREVFDHMAEIRGGVVSPAPTFVAHWVYTKRGFKRQGIASAVLTHALERIGRGCTDLLMTHRTYIEEKAESLGFEFVKLEELYLGDK